MADLVIGEAKSFAINAITKEVIDGLKIVAERFPNTFLAVAVLKNESRYTKKPVSLHWRGGVPPYPREVEPIHPLIVMTGTELFANWQIDQAKKDTNGRSRRISPTAAGPPTVCFPIA